MLFPWSRMSGANATVFAPRRAASRTATLPTRSIVSRDSLDSSPRPTSSSVFALMLPAGGVMMTVSNSSPTNSPRSRREAITPPRCLSNSTGAPVIFFAPSAVYLK